MINILVQEYISTRRGETKSTYSANKTSNYKTEMKQKALE